MLSKREISKKFKREKIQALLGILWRRDQQTRVPRSSAEQFQRPVKPSFAQIDVSSRFCESTGTGLQVAPFLQPQIRLKKSNPIANNVIDYVYTPHRHLLPGNYFASAL